ncbi:Sugar (and other) transporter [Corynebacterium epidermidicanis]|uniref:Sugar (And other) transporter n=1 Tax=Corynebacterium epidermidicanis TaxID=1050174 RepID=A0A0G3GT46_9CORY|nr:Sugar (and other) transporter [Corynebacterium epidermidicanis]
MRGSAGNLVEWYDVYTYTVFSSYFASQFFGDVKNSQMNSMAVFATTFVMRPIGSWFFGRWADRHGRKSALTFSVLMMAAASFVIAILPTHATIGFAAVIALVICRLVQGFATGGEYGTSATYTSEAATRDRRGFLSSFQYVTLVGGEVLATLVLLIMQQVMSEQDIKAWGWRIPFLIGGLGAVVVFWLRRSMDESLPQESVDKQSGSMGELLTKYWSPLLLVFLLTLGGTMCFYAFSVSGPAMIKTAYKSSPETATNINLLTLIVLLILQPIGGLISDKIGRKPLLVWFGAGALVWTYFFVT